MSADRQNGCDRRSFLSGSFSLLAANLLSPSLRELSDGAISQLISLAPRLEYLSAVEAARAIRARKISSLELTQKILDRIRRLDVKLNSVVTVGDEAALTHARNADKALARGEWWGPLHGVPCTIKDLYNTAGMRSTAGSKAFAEYVPSYDALQVARFRKSGAVLIGKTNVPLFARDWQTYNDVFGTTNNPWDTTRTPGGSTGGGAAAVAAGFSYLEVGGDIGGSIRVPAHFCGVYGHKTSLGVIPSRGSVSSQPNQVVAPPDLAVVGPIARSAGDLKVALELMGGPDTDEATAYRWSLPRARATRLSDYRIGYVLDDPHCPVSSEMRGPLSDMVQALRKTGAKVSEGWPANISAADQFETYRFIVYSGFAALTPEDQFDDMRKLAAKKDGSFESIWAWSFTAPHKYFMEANNKRFAARAAWQEYFRTHDAFLMPAAFVPAFPHDHKPNSQNRVIVTPEGRRPYLDLLYWISFASLTGLPATVAPIGLTSNNLPVGIQVMGPYLEDATPIDVAGKIGDLMGGFKAPPGY